MPPQDGPDELSANSNSDSSSFHDETDDTDSISKLDLNAQPNGVSPRGPSGTVSHLTRSSGLVFINYTPTDDRQQHHRVIPTTNPPTPDLEPADNHTLRHRRSHSSQISAHHSPYQPPSSRDLSGSTLAGSIDSTPSPLPASLSRTGNGSPFPALTPQSGLALPPPLSTPRCPTCGRRSDSYYYHGPLPTASSSIAPNSSRLTPHRPAPPPPTATTPSPALTRHRSNALTTTPFRLQSPPRGRHQRHNPSTVLRGGAASTGPRPPPLLRTHTSPMTATLALPAAAPLYAARRRSQPDSLRRARSPPARLRRQQQQQQQQQETTPPCTPPRTPRLRPRAGTGGGGAGAAGMEEFERLVERLRRAYAGEDEGGREY